HHATIPIRFPYTTLFRSRRCTTALTPVCSPKHLHHHDAFLNEKRRSRRRLRSRQRHLQRKGGATGSRPKQPQVSALAAGQLTGRSEEHTSELQSLANPVC